MTWKQIYEAIQNQTELLGTTGTLRVKEISNLAYQKLIDRHPWSWNKKKDTNIAIAATENTELFPKDFRQIMESGFLLKSNVNSELKALTYKNLVDFKVLYPRLEDGQSEGVPIHYTISSWDDTNDGIIVEVGPWPDGAYTGELHYYYMPDDMAVDSDIPETPRGFHRLIVDIGVALAEEKLDEKRWTAIWNRVEGEFLRSVAMAGGEEDQPIVIEDPRRGTMRWIRS